MPLSEFFLIFEICFLLKNISERGGGGSVTWCLLQQIGVSGTVAGKNTALLNYAREKEKAFSLISSKV